MQMSSSFDIWRSSLTPFCGSPGCLFELRIAPYIPFGSRPFDHIAHLLLMIRYGPSIEDELGSSVERALTYRVVPGVISYYALTLNDKRSAEPSYCFQKRGFRYTCPLREGVSTDNAVIFIESVSPITLRWKMYVL